MRLALGLALALWVGVAWAGDQAEYGPPAAWVKPVEIPAPLADSKTDTQVLLENFQDNYGPDGDDYFEEIAERIQTPQGLDKLGSVVLEWRPDVESLVIHKLQIIRDSQVIDVLANGQKFLVLRRENNLEMAMLDGALTAAIQPEGLQIGDTLDIAFTRKFRYPLFKGRSQLFSHNLGAVPVRHLYVREMWPQSKHLQWRQTEGLAPAKLTDTPEGHELTIDMTDLDPIKAPRGAPARFSNINQLEISEFPDWSDVSALMAPLYEKAATLAPDSPIKAEAAKIAAASNDPKVRAAMALQIVQDKVRYLFLGMDRGGYIPADADRTWTRRFGDCKGKTVLLLAFLHELGIDARPATVSAANGDGLDTLLPLVQAFNHVLVRAQIGGKVYWLDGTRTGDRDLDGLTVPRFWWALPLQASGATLEKLVTAPFDKPAVALNLHLDASKGIDTPASAHAEQILRGDPATALKLKLGRLSPTDLQSFLRKFWSEEYDWIDIEKVDFSYDDTAGETHLSMDGSAKMSWKVYRGEEDRQFRVEGSQLGWTPDFIRDPGPHQEAPFAIDYPFFAKTTQTIVLPKEGKGFSIDGANVDTAIGGYEFKRVSRIDKGVFTMSASTRSIAPEFPAADAPKVKTALKSLSDVTVFLHAPTAGRPGYDPKGIANGSVSDTKAQQLLLAAVDEATAQGHLDDALQVLNQGLIGMEDSTPLVATRAHLYVLKGDPEHAEKDIEHALKLAPNDKGVLTIKAEVEMAKQQFDAAFQTADMLVHSYPDDARVHTLRGGVYLAQGDKEKALLDYNEAVRLNPDEPGARFARASFYLSLRNLSGALADSDKLLAVAPDNPRFHDLRGYVLNALGRRDEALVEYNAALAIAPEAGAYLFRAQARGFGDHKAVLADLDSALKLQPKLAGAYQLRAQIYFAEFDYSNALKALDNELKYAPLYSTALHLRALALAGTRDYAGAVAQLGALIAMQPQDGGLFVERCRYKAARGENFDDALSDCQQAGRLMPQSDDVETATAYVYQRFGKFDDALKKYDQILERRPNSAVLRFGRRITEIAAGRPEKAKTDIVAAREIDPDIDREMGPFMAAPNGFDAGNAGMKSLQNAALATVTLTAVPKSDQKAEDPSAHKTSRKPVSISRPNYPSAAEDQQIEGYVDFEFTVEPDGSVGEPKITREFPEMYGFADAAIKVFPKWKFLPETVDGKAVPTKAFYRFSFKMQRDG